MEQATKTKRKGGQLSSVMRSLRKNRMAMVGLVILILLILVAIFFFFFATYPYDQ